MTGFAALGLAADPGPADPRLVARLRALVLDPGPLPAEIDVPAGGFAADDDALVAALTQLVPAARERHRREGIDEAVTAATLRDVGRKHDLYGAASVLEWMLGLLRGDVVELGRLQVERRPGPRGHALHVPETGPLTPGAVDEALARARDTLGATAFSCESWLLDPVLAVELAGSNIAAFAARFDLVGHVEPTPAASEEAAKFVFRRSAAEVRTGGGVEPRTRLEHAVASRLRADEEWSAPLGVLR